MLNFYQSNDKSYEDAQAVYVATCITHGFFQDVCRTIGDAIFVHAVTSRVYITFMVLILTWFLYLELEKSTPHTLFHLQV